jgi:hypothetical protein
MRFVRGLVSLGVVTALLLPASAGRAASGHGPAQGAALLITEVQYDPPGSGNDAGYEWVELHNPGTEPVGLAGWQLADARDAVPLPDAAVGPGEFLVVAAGDGFTEQHPGFAGRVLLLGGRIGNGLGNSGDQVRLLGSDGSVVDGLSYGEDTGVLDPAIPDVPAEHSLERVPAGRDTDTAADWLDQSVPTPGSTGTALPPTGEPATAPPPTVAAGVQVVLNEYLPSPKAIDWDGDGQVTTADEWIELFNAGEVPISLRGWQLDDIADGGSTPFALPDDAEIPPHGHLVFFGKTTKLQLNNGGDSLRLLAPDGSLRDETSFTKSSPDGAIARLGDGDGPWTDTLAPSPGQTNGSGAAPTSAAETPTAAASRAPTTAARTPTPPAHTPGATPPRGTLTPAYLPLLLSEVLPNPLRAGDDAADEWIELFNPGTAPVNLSGWAIGDGRSWDSLPAAVVPPRGFAVVVASRALSETLTAAGVVVTKVVDGRLGNGLANGGDVLRLRGPTGQVVDAVSYGDDLTAFDPAVPLGPPGSSLERIPPELDTDRAEDWWPQPAPSPGRAGLRHEAPPEVRLNELLAAPSRHDWDGNGTADHTDEWLELVNLADHPVPLAGWRVVVGAGAGWDWRFPDDARIEAGAFLVLHRAVTGLSLVNAGDQVRLLRADRMVADEVTWSTSTGYDRTLGRLPDGDGPWHAGLPGTPGEPNRAAGPIPLPVATRLTGESAPEPAPDRALAELRQLRAGARVRVRGQVTMPPGPLGLRNAYIGDSSGGVRVYLSERGGRLPPWTLGEHVMAVGRLTDYRGERQLTVERVSDFTPLGPGAPLAPLPAGVLDESVEGRLVQLSGSVVTVRRASFDVDTGVAVGPIQVAVRLSTGIHRPAARRGQRLAVVGVASQSVARAPWVGGWSLLLRQPADIAATASGAPARPRAELAVRSRALPAEPQTGPTLPTRAMSLSWPAACCAAF